MRKGLVGTAELLPGLHGGLGKPAQALPCGGEQHSKLDILIGEPVSHHLGTGRGGAEPLDTLRNKFEMSGGSTESLLAVRNDGVGDTEVGHGYSPSDIPVTDSIPSAITTYGTSRQQVADS
jgi:hypothetical protein